MRVIAGTAKGRTLVAPRGLKVRPTTDRAKEALFSALGGELRGAVVLDLYAGVGSLGIEALSRGAAHATFVERSRRVVAALQRNLDHTGLADRATVVTGDVVRVLRQGPPGGPFDLVLVDPPYDLPEHRLAEALAALRPHLAPDAHIVVERSSRSPAPPWPAGVHPGRVRRYGDTCLYEAWTGPGEPGGVTR